VNAAATDSALQIYCLGINEGGYIDNPASG